MIAADVKDITYCWPSKSHCSTPCVLSVCRSPGRAPKWVTFFSYPEFSLSSFSFFLSQSPTNRSRILSFLDLLNLGKNLRIKKQKDVISPCKSFALLKTHKSTHTPTF